MRGVREILNIGAVAVGLDVGTTAVKVVNLRRAARGVEVHRFGITPLPRGAVEAGLILDRAAVAGVVDTLLRGSGIRARRAVISVTGQNVLARILRLPPIPEDEVRQAIRWEAERHLPFPVDEAVIDAQIVREVSEDGQRQIEVLLAAAPEGLVLAHVETMEAAHVYVEAVEVGALAMARALRPAAEQGTFGLVNLGGTATDVAIVRDGVPQLTRTILLGMAGVTDVLALDDLVGQLRRSLDFYRAQFAGAVVDGIVLCGGGVRLPRVVEHLAAELDVPVSVGDPFAAIRPGGGLDAAALQEHAPQLVVATGLALRTMV